MSLTLIPGHLSSAPRAPFRPTMAGLLKRKFDQLEEGFFSSSSSSSSSSGSLSLSSSPGSSVFPAWNSDEEGPVSQAPQPDQDFCSLQSFTRKSSVLETPTYPFSKGEIGLCFAALGIVNLGVSSYEALYCPLPRDTWACLDLPLTLGVMLSAIAPLGF